MLSGQPPSNFKILEGSDPILMNIHIHLCVCSVSPSFALQEEMTQKKIICQLLFTQKLLGDCTWPAQEERWMKNVMLKANLREVKLIF